MLVEIVRKKRQEKKKRVEEGEEGGILLSRLVAGLIRGEIKEEVVDNVVLLVFAAHDTISFTIAMTFRMLAHHPTCYALLYQNMLKAIVDIEYEGYTIPRGWKVLWTAYGTHYNPKYFGDPSTFDPSRFEDAVPPYVFVPFEGGPRVCAGYQLAKLNILIFLHFVVTHYDWSLRYLDEPITMDPLPFPFQEMPIKISPKPII
uniref:Uncharacterized protein n=1 Tax=Vitis vinifera TaxID=29760 RepID=F6HNZ5_VITVI